MHDEIYDVTCMERDASYGTDNHVQGSKNVRGDGVKSLQISAQLDGLFGGLSGLPQLPGLPQLVPLTLPQLPSLPSLIPTGGGGDPLSQMLGNLGVLFQGIPQPPVAPSATLPPLPPPASPPPLPSPPLILPLSSTEITTIATVTPAPETSIFITFPTLVSETDVLNAENIDNGQTSFLGVIPDEDYATEEDIDGAPDFTGFLSHGDHWTTEGKRNDKNSQPDGRGKSHVNDGDTGKEFLCVILESKYH
ncbi:unnamed protein product [Toxocara canis]|uniref:Zinc finger protein n=1 Tax=Toxocara canis TaxID=6265 RepID=A0A183V5N7_TOXCA|nr:unnamed protein product [Toxocara canis]